MLPEGNRVWQCFDEETAEFVDRSLSVTLLRNKAELEAAEADFLAGVAADTAARAALATEQLSGEVVAVLMEVSPPPISTPNPPISRSDSCASSFVLAQD